MIPPMLAWGLPEWSLSGWDGSAGPPLWQLVALALAGVLAGIVNTVAGGGSFVTVAALVTFGLPAPEANATNRVGVVAQSAVAAASFRSESVSGGGDLLAQLLVSATGAALGAGLSMWMDPKDFERALGLAMVATLVVSLVRPRSWSEPSPPSPWRWPALLGASMYGGFVQAGVGVLLLPCLVQLGGLDAVSANARKVLLMAWYTLPPLLMYTWAGLVDWPLGLVLAVSSAAGGCLGAKLTVGLGARLVQGVLIAVVAVTAFRLLF